MFIVFTGEGTGHVGDPQEGLAQGRRCLRGLGDAAGMAGQGLPFFRGKERCTGEIGCGSGQQGAYRIRQATME